MAINVDGGSGQNGRLPKPLQWFTRRELLWAWCVVAPRMPEGSPAGYTNVLMRDALIARAAHDAETFSNLAKSRMLPIEEFDWIKKDRRQEIWLYHASDELPSIDKSVLEFVDAIPGLSFKEFIVLRSDLSDMRQDDKLACLRRMRCKWNDLADESHSLKWLDKSNAKQCEWAWDYMRKTALTSQLKFSLESEDPYVAVLSVVDTAFSHPAERQLFFIKMHDAWNRFKHRRSNENKAQCNFWLTKDAKLALDQLAKRRGMKKNALLEELIYEGIYKLNTGQEQPKEKDDSTQPSAGSNDAVIGAQQEQPKKTIILERRPKNNDE